MRKCLFVFIAVICVSLIHAQSCDSFNLGTKTTYQTPVGLITPAPAGFSPIFINHVGRHGARHLTKEVPAAGGYRLLEDAVAKQLLTEKGIRLLAILKTLAIIEQGNTRSISLLGQQEQMDIAKRMYRNYPNLFQSVNAPMHSVMITKEIRTKQSAAAFLRGLQSVMKNKDSLPYIINDTILRFYDLAPAYLDFEKNGNWNAAIEKLKQTVGYKKMVELMLPDFFQSSFIAAIDYTTKEKFVTDVYGFLSILPSVKEESNQKAAGFGIDSLKQFFTCAQLEILGLIDNAEDYLLKGPGLDANGIQVKIATPLLVDFIKATDQFIKNGNNTVELRFTHAESIAPFAALLGLQHAATPAKDITHFKEYWNAADVVPLSANIQWVLYQNKKTNKYLVKFLLNENEVTVAGLITKTFPFYDWDSVRKLYITKLKTLKTNIYDNQYQFLQQLK